MGLDGQTARCLQPANSKSKDVRVLAGIKATLQCTLVCIVVVVLARYTVANTCVFLIYHRVTCYKEAFGGGKEAFGGRNELPEKNTEQNQTRQDSQ